MRSRHLVDPELLPFLDQFPPIEFSVEGLPQLRRTIADRARSRIAAAPLNPDEIDVLERRVPGPQGAPDVRVLIYTPKAATGLLPALLHIHGGGFVVGTPDASDAGNRVLAKAAGCVIVSVDYRLAPETPYPGPVEDCYAVLKWVHAQAAELGVDSGRIAIGGESAGGGLAACLALLNRDRTEIPVMFQLLIYPMLDDREGEFHPYTGEQIWTAESNRFGWNALLGAAAGSHEVSPFAAAARAADLSALPAAFIAVGTLDLLIEQNLDYARRLIRAGVQTELHVYPGAYHGFNAAADAQVAAAFKRDCVVALRRAFGRAAQSRSS
jgi:acetyl esterase/lipase